MKNKIQTPLLVACIALVGFSSGHATNNSAPAASQDVQNSKPLEEPQVKQVVNGFFSALEIGNQPKKLFGEYVTDDFLIFEMGRKYTLKELLESFHAGDREWISTRWVLSDFRISLDQHSAHASYLNTGKFLYREEGKTFRSDLQWLESVYLVRRSGKLKIHFLQSDDIEKKVTEIDNRP